jgi:hypothetical protein
VITTPSLATITLATPSVTLTNTNNNNHTNINTINSSIISNITNITNNSNNNAISSNNNTGNVLRTLGNSFVPNTATLANIQNATLNNHVFGYGILFGVVCFAFIFCFYFVQLLKYITCKTLLEFAYLPTRTRKHTLEIPV